MKTYLTILLSLVSMAAFGKIYPATDYAGSNVLTLTAQPWIQITNGFGTNVTLISSKSITTTNLSAISDTYLNSSNVHVYFVASNPGTNSGALIPQMTSSNQPSGLATGGFQFPAGPPGNDNYNAFNVFSAQTFGTNLVEYLQYQFSSLQNVSNFNGDVEGNVAGGGGYVQLEMQASTDGVSWTSLATTNGVFSSLSGTNVGFGFSPVIASYFKWIFTVTNNTSRVLATRFQVYGNSVASLGYNLVNSSSNTLEILATNGFTVNTPNANGYTVNINGSLNVTNISIAGVPVGSAPVIAGGNFDQLWVTNGFNAATNFNGMMFNTGLGYYTNALSWYLVLKGSVISGSNFTATYNANTLTTNLNGVPIPQYQYQYLLGTYPAIAGSPTNTLPVVSIPSSFISGITNSGTSGGAATNISAGQGIAVTAIGTSNVISVVAPVVTNGVYAASTSLVLAASNNASGRSIVATPRDLTFANTNSAGKVILSLNSGGGNFDGELALRSDQGGTVTLKASDGSGAFSGTVSGLAASFSGEVDANSLVVANNSTFQATANILGMFFNPASGPVPGADTIDFNGDGSAYFGTGAVLLNSSGITGNGSAITNIPISGLSTNGGNINQVPAVRSDGKVVWTNVASGNSTTNLPFFNVADYGAVGNGTTDDTTALQSAINAAQVVAGTVLFGPHSYKTTNPLVITNAITLQGTGVNPIYGVFGSAPYGGSVLPITSPYLTGSVILMSALNKDAVIITNTGTAVNVYDLGIRFATAFTNTGHGFNCSSPDISGGQDQGIFGATWRNAIVYGQDGNHYGFRFVNIAYNTFINLQTFGGGGFEIYTHAAVAVDGNSEFISPYSCLAVRGTGYGYYLHGTATNHGVNLVHFLRPQTFLFANLAGVLAPDSSQYQFYADIYTQLLNIEGGDFESDNGGGAGVFYPGTLGVGTDNSFIQVTWQSTGGLQAQPLGYVRPGTSFAASNITANTITATNLILFGGTVTTNLPYTVGLDRAGAYYYYPSSRSYSTNATLVAATSLVVLFSPPFDPSDTNYTISSPNDLVGATVTDRKTNSFTISFTSATITSQVIEGVIHHK